MASILYLSAYFGALDIVITYTIIRSFLCENAADASGTAITAFIEYASKFKSDVLNALLLVRLLKASKVARCAGMLYSWILMRNFSRLKPFWQI